MTFRKNKYRKFYNARAKNVWGKVPYLYGRDIFSIYWDMREKDIVRRRLSIGAKCRVLDVCSGPGRWILEHSLQGAEVVGLDISFEMIRSAKSKLPKKLLRKVHFVCADGEHLPFRKEVFDFITCFDAFPDFPNPQKGLFEMRGALRNDGVLLVEQTNILSLMGAAIAVVREFYAPILRFLGKEAGFKWFDKWTRYEFATTVIAWLRSLDFTYKVVGVNILPTPPCEQLLRFLLGVEQRLEDLDVFNLIGYRLAFICTKKHDPTQ